MGIVSNNIVKNLVDGFAQFATIAEKGDKADKFVHINAKNLFDIKADKSDKSIQDAVPLVKKQLAVLNKVQATEVRAQIEKTRQAYEKAANSFYTFFGLFKREAVTKLRADVVVLTDLLLTIDSGEVVSNKEKSRQTAAAKDVVVIAKTILEAQFAVEGHLTSSPSFAGKEAPDMNEALVSLKEKVTKLKTADQVSSVKEVAEKARATFKSKYDARWVDFSQNAKYLKTQVAAFDDLVKAIDDKASTFKSSKVKAEKSESTVDDSSVNLDDSAQEVLDAKEKVNELRTEIAELKAQREGGQRGLSAEISERNKELGNALRAHRETEKTYVALVRAHIKALQISAKSLRNPIRDAQGAVVDARADRLDQSEVRKLEKEADRLEKKLGSLQRKIATHAAFIKDYDDARRAADAARRAARPAV